MKRLVFIAAFVLCAPVAQATVVPIVTVYVRPNADGNCHYSPDACIANLQTIEEQAGRQLGLSTYVPFDFTSIPDAEWADANGRPVEVTIQHTVNGDGCLTIADVLAGKYDAQIAYMNSYFATYHKRVLIRLIPELNKPHQACIYQNDPVAHPELAGPEFIDFWQYMRARLTSPNIILCWSPGSDAFSDSNGNPITIWQYFYPGSGMVDRIGDEIYNSSGITPTPIQDAPKFINFYSQVSPLGIPLSFTETGAVNNDAIDKSPQQKWFWSMGANFRQNYPMVVSLAQFDVDAEADFRLAGRGLDAFTHMATKVYFSNMNP